MCCAVHVELLLMLGTAEEELFKMASASWIGSEKEVAAVAAAEARAGAAGGGDSGGAQQNGEAHAVRSHVNQQGGEGGVGQQGTAQENGVSGTAGGAATRVALEKRGIRNLFFLHLRKVGC